MGVRLAELAAEFDCELVGDPDIEVDRVATLAAAGPGSLSFLANPLYRAQLAATQASAVVVEPGGAGHCPAAALVASNPYATYARIAARLHPAVPPAPGVHASAVVSAGAVVAESAEIGPHAVIGAGSRIGAAVVIGAGSVVGAGVTIGAGTRIAPRVSVLDGVTVGARCVIHAGAVIGADGFGFAPDAGRWVKVPQIGAVRIGDDVEIGANTTIDRGTIDDTVIGDGVKLDNLIQIAHNVRIGEHTVMAAMAGAAGSTKIGRGCMIGGGAVMIGHIEIGDGVTILFKSIVTKSIPAGETWSGGLPAEEASRWRRNAARFRQLDALAVRLKALETKFRHWAAASQGKHTSND